MTMNYKKNRARISTLDEYLERSPPPFKKTKSIALTLTPGQITQACQGSSSKNSNNSRSPLRNKDSYSDRFIPIRNESESRKIWFDISEDSNNSTKHSDFFTDHFQNTLKYHTLLEGQIFGNSQSNTNSTTACEEVPKVIRCCSPQGRPKLFSFKSSVKSENNIQAKLSGPLAYDKIPVEEFKNLRKIPEKCYKILEAPFLLDDYYLNLVDWSNGPFLAVALRGAVYLWCPKIATVDKFELNNDNGEIYSSVCWNQNGDLLSCAKYEGKLEVWDIIKRRPIREDLEHHKNRVGCLNWNGCNLLASGSRDKSILVHDLRLPTNHTTVAKFKAHKQEVCGLKWSPNDYQLASGGNDNKLILWNMKTSGKEMVFDDHKAAVKAIEWSPHQTGLLLSGGGNSDKTIKFWNTLTMKQIKNINTGSQVCNLKFSKNSNEFVSTHGFSNNQIIIWKYPSLEKLTILEGHTSRVLYLTLSRDGQTIVTGAGDETLRFWNVFPSSSTVEDSILVPSGSEVR